MYGTQPISPKLSFLSPPQVDEILSFFVPDLPHGPGIARVESNPTIVVLEPFKAEILTTAVVMYRERGNL